MINLLHTSRCQPHLFGNSLYDRGFSLKVGGAEVQHHLCHSHRCTWENTAVLVDLILPRIFSIGVLKKNLQVLCHLVFRVTSHCLVKRKPWQYEERHEKKVNCWIVSLCLMAAWVGSVSNPEFPQHCSVCFRQLVRIMMSSRRFVVFQPDGSSSLIAPDRL